MIFLRSAVLASFFLTTFSLGGADGPKLSEHPFFKHLVGSWKTAGELKGADGNVVKVKQEWTCKILDERELLIEGTRSFNDGAPDKYRWSITHNATTDMYEAVLSNPEDQSNSLRFEGNVTGDPPICEFKAQFGNGGGSAVVTDSFTGGGYDAFDTKVVLTKDNGDPNLEGTIKNERVK
jgi:hypothetical protein